MTAALNAAACPFHTTGMMMYISAIPAAAYLSNKMNIFTNNKTKHEFKTTLYSLIILIIIVFIVILITR